MPSQLRAASAVRRAADPRVVGGIVLMAASAYAGLVLLGGDDATSQVAVATRDLPAGIELADGDLALVPVVVAEPDRYLTEAAAEGSLTRPVGQGELIPVGAVADGRPEYRTIAVPVDLERLPPGLQRGARVDLWASGAGSAVLTGATVLSVTDPEQWAGATATVVIAVAPDDVPAVLAATRAGPVDLTGYEAVR